MRWHGVCLPWVGMGKSWIERLFHASGRRDCLFPTRCRPSSLPRLLFRFRYRRLGGTAFGNRFVRYSSELYLPDVAGGSVPAAVMGLAVRRREVEQRLGSRSQLTSVRRQKPSRRFGPRLRSWIPLSRNGQDVLMLRLTTDLFSLSPGHRGESHRLGFSSRSVCGSMKAISPAGSNERCCGDSSLTVAAPDRPNRYHLSHTLPTVFLAQLLGRGLLYKRVVRQGLALHSAEGGRGVC